VLTILYVIAMLNNFSIANTSPHCGFSSSSYSKLECFVSSLFVGCVVYTSIGLNSSFITFRFNSQIHVTLNPNYIYIYDTWSNTLFTHLNSMWPCLVHCNYFLPWLHLSFMNAILNGLKHETSKHCRTCEVCDNKITMSKPNWWAFFIASRVTCDPCPSIINNW